MDNCKPHESLSFKEHSWKEGFEVELFCERCGTIQKTPELNKVGQLEKEKCDELPRSRNIGQWEAKDYWVTAGSWDTGYGNSYEIGIRRKNSGVFDLIQSGWNETTVKIAARAVVLMLDDCMCIVDIRAVVSS